jgi:hypothetical protein
MLIGLSFLFVFITSCSVHKRYHRKGYTVTWNKVKTVQTQKQKQSPKFDSKKMVAETKETPKDSLFFMMPAKEAEMLKGKSISLNLLGQTKIKTQGNQLENRNFIKKETKRNLYSTKIQNQAAVNLGNDSKKIQKSTNLKPTSFDGAGRSLGIAGVILLIGLILGLLGALLSIQILGLISIICFGISGLFFMLFIFEGLLTILTFGML